MELKPGPFCGGHAMLCQVTEPRTHRPSRYHPYCVICAACDLFFGYDEDYGGRFDTEQEAIEAWNRRGGEKNG